MSKFLYARLAASNLRKNAGVTLPYILTSIFTVAMFYMMLFLTTHSGLTSMPRAVTIVSIMRLGSIVIAIFSVLILLYTNSFLMKRRKKELGLYNVLGMGKRHITRVMFFETVYTALIALIGGLFVGILLSKLILLLLLRLLAFSVPFGFEVSSVAVTLTLALFAAIFVATLIINAGRVHLSKPVELLRGSNVGEKEPKTKWLLAIVGFLCLGAGYTIANVVEEPVEALGWFFIAVLLVIAGTYFLFIAGSIALLKVLRKNKAYYYQTRHFTAISGMIYRMKQNAAGLASICVLITMVLVMISTTVSLNVSLEDILRNQYPRDIALTSPVVTQKEADALTERIDRQIAQAGIETSNVLNYRISSWTFYLDGETLRSSRTDGASGDLVNVTFITLDDYIANNQRDAVDAPTLAPGELLLYVQGAAYTAPVLDFNGIEYSVKTILSDLNLFDHGIATVNQTFALVLPSETDITAVIDELEQQAGSGSMTYFYAFDTNADDETESALAAALSESLSGVTRDNGDELYTYIMSVAQDRTDFLSIYGGLLFLGLFLGALFFMATVVIMYYKQITEGYDDQKRFEIMQKVGLVPAEIKASIRSQVLIVFFLPLAVAGVHILAAFRMITKLLYMLNLTDVGLFAVCTIATFAVFAVLYGIVYALTARAYYKIVS